MDLDHYHSSAGINPRCLIRSGAAIFPETLDGGASYVSTQYEHGEPSCVQRLLSLSQLLKDAIIMLIHYQGAAPHYQKSSEVNSVIDYDKLRTGKITRINFL